MEVFDQDGEFTKVFRLQLKEIVQEISLSDAQIESLLAAFRDTVKVLIDEESDRIWASIRKVATKKELDELQTLVKTVTDKVSDGESEEIGRQKLLNKVMFYVGGVASIVGVLAYFNTESVEDPKIKILEAKLEALSK